MKFEILNITKSSEHTCKLSISYDREFEAIVATHYNKKRVTESDVQNFVYHVIDKYLDVNQFYN